MEPMGRGGNTARVPVGGLTGSSRLPRRLRATGGSTTVWGADTLLEGGDLAHSATSLQGVSLYMAREGQSRPRPDGILVTGLKALLPPPQGSLQGVVVDGAGCTSQSTGGRMKSMGPGGGGEVRLMAFSTSGVSGALVGGISHALMWQGAISAA